MTIPNTTLRYIVQCLIVLMHIYCYLLLVPIYYVYHYMGNHASPWVWYICTFRNILNVQYILPTHLAIYRLIPNNWVVRSIFSFELSLISSECILLLLKKFIRPNFASFTYISYHGAYSSRNYHFLRSLPYAPCQCHTLHTMGMGYVLSIEDNSWCKESD